MSQVEQVSVQQALALIDTGAVLLDVREPEETTAGLAPGALVIPMQSFDMARVPIDQQIVVICRSGARSERVAGALIAAGWTACNLTGGMHAWEAAGQPILNSAGEPGFVN